MYKTEKKHLDHEHKRKTLLNMSSSSSSSSYDLSIFFPFTNDPVSEISYTHQYSSLFSNPLQKLAQNVPDHQLLMEMEAGDVNMDVSTGGAAAEKVWTVPSTSFNGNNGGNWTHSCHENGGYIRKMSPPIMEEGKLKVGRCNADERKEKIQRYRVKKKQRNFNKTIKYVCRKTLADSRTRIRGRFAPTKEIDGIFVNGLEDHDLGPTRFEFYTYARGNIFDDEDTFDSFK